jgi:hypothetical protein
MPPYESRVGEAALEWLAQLDFEIAYWPAIAPGELGVERFISPLYRVSTNVSTKNQDIRCGLPSIARTRMHCGVRVYIPLISLNQKKGERA